MNSPVLGIQLYTLRDFCGSEADFDRTLSFLSDLGVKDIQISAIGDIEPEKQKNLLLKHNMRVCVTHKPFDRIISDTDALIAEHKIINCDALGLGGMPDEFRHTQEAADRFIEKIASVGAKLKNCGMSFNYHNHNFEFEKLENGLTLMDYLIENTDREYFKFIPDIAWIQIAGQNPTEYLRKMKGRIKVCHFKDYTSDENGKPRFCTLGEGLVDLKACYKTCCELEVPYIMYEQDDGWTDGDAKKATALSWEFMQTLR